VKPTDERTASHPLTETTGTSPRHRAWLWSASVVAAGVLVLLAVGGTREGILAAILATACAWIGSRLEPPRGPRPPRASASPPAAPAPAPPAPRAPQPELPRVERARMADFAWC